MKGLSKTTSIKRTTSKLLVDQSEKSFNSNLWCL